MTDTDVRSGAGLSRRAWTAVGAIMPGAAVATIAACCAAAALTSGAVRMITVFVVLVVCAALGLLWAARRGAEATHRRVAGLRAEWVRTQPTASTEQDGPADPGDVALALPRGWRVEVARGRLRLLVNGAVVRAETWVLRAVPGSRRARRRREVVSTAANTRGVRTWLALGTAVDSMLIVPAWTRGDETPDPEWMPAVRERVARHEDLLAALTIGDDRVILFALDDPRPEVMMARAQLVSDVARLIG